MDYKWKVAPIQGRQLLDVREEDLFGDFRLCETYRGGGGYDQFPKIFKRRSPSAMGDFSKQFVVQLYGCPLDCPYCYVTRDGVFGKYVEYTTPELIDAFMSSDTSVFHLMGGAPALYLDKWFEIVDNLPNNAVFHSDLMLVEKEYKVAWLTRINKPNVLLAVNIKGVTKEDFHRNTNRKLDLDLFWFNMDVVYLSGINFYFTYTNPDMDYLDYFERSLVHRYGHGILRDSYVIDLIKYKALEGDI